MALYNQYFDLWQVFVVELIGDVWLAVLLATIIIILIAVRTRIPYHVTLMFVFLWLMVAYAATYLTEIWIFVVLGTGILFFFRISKLIQRN